MSLWLDLGDYHGPGHFHAFLMYAVARTRNRAMDEAYRSYVADSLQNIPQGRYITRRFSDLTRPHEEIDADATIERVTRALEA